MEARAVLMSEEIERGPFDYLKWFPEGNKADVLQDGENLKLNIGDTTIGEYYDQWIETKNHRLSERAWNAIIASTSIATFSRNIADGS